MRLCLIPSVFQMWQRDDSGYVLRLRIAGRMAEAQSLRPYIPLTALPRASFGTLIRARKINAQTQGAQNPL